MTNSTVWIRSTWSWIARINGFFNDRFNRSGSTSYKWIANVSVRTLANSIMTYYLTPRVEIKLYKLWSVWVITFFGHNCHFVQNSLIIFNVILIQNLQFYSKYKPKSKPVEISLWKISNFLMKFLILCLWPKIVISDFLCENIPR